MVFNLEPNIWSSCIAYGPTYKDISIYKLVHKDCHYQNHTWGHHALSISSILIIDDNPFYEGLYNELRNHAKDNARMHEQERQMH